MLNPVPGRALEAEANTGKFREGEFEYPPLTSSREQLVPEIENRVLK
jgi:hypothetical protein